MTRPSSRLVTVTFSPALDVSTDTALVIPTRKLRCSASIEHPGGGGVNVARVATRLGAEVQAIMPLGGSTGARVGELIRGADIGLVAVPVSSSTRQSFSVTEQSSGEQYRFVAPTPKLSADEIEAIMTATAEACQGGADCLVVSGQMPPEVAEDVFTRFVEMMAPAPVIVDTSGPALRSALRSGVALVKPSARELGSIVDRELLTELEILDAVMQIRAESNVGHLVVSIGPGGAISIDPNGAIRRFRAPTVRVQSTIGAGDSMVAGIAVALSAGSDHDEAIGLGIAAGTAAVLTEGTDLCHSEDVERLRPLVSIEDVDRDDFDGPSR